MEETIRQIAQGFIAGARVSGADDLESSFLEELVGGFEANAKQARRAIRKLLLYDKAKFFCSACRILKRAVESPGHEYLMKLLLEGDLLQISLADPKLFPVGVAMSLAQAVARLDPLLDFKLMQLLFRGDQTDDGEVDPVKAQRVLEIVTVLPKHTRILPLLLKLLRFSDPRLRSKAVLLFCQVSKNPQWAERQLSDDDARVRASAVEGLWGNDTPGARAVLREAARDSDHRVVANSLVGLYLLDEPSAAAQLAEMAAHPGPLFRAAAAFAMGQTRHEGFVPQLGQMVKDYNAKVRSTALRALVRIRRKGHEAAIETAIYDESPEAASLEEGASLRVDSAESSVTEKAEPAPG